MRRIEVCCGSLSDVLAAKYGGAVRVELCQALEVGGLTPSPGLMAGAVRERGDMHINVLIRPRPGDFCYTTREVSVMEADIEAARAVGADGVVIGALTLDGHIDEKVMHRLLRRAEGMDVTFHRAFDEVVNPFASLEWIRTAGIKRILTSGLAPSASEGAELLARLVEAAGDIVIMPGAGINPSNITELEKVTKACEFHSTCTDKAAPRRNSVLFGQVSPSTDAAIVRALVGAES